MLQRLFFEHFRSTSFVIDSDGELQAFVLAFQSQSEPSVVYIHFVGVNPQCRTQGYGRKLYAHLSNVAYSLDCTELRCITSPANKGSIAFHQRMGFELLAGNGEVNGVPVTLDHGGEGQHRVLFRKMLA
jgi:predicted GNAT superfamily acetyltransferase